MGQRNGSSTAEGPRKQTRGQQSAGRAVKQTEGRRTVHFLTGRLYSWMCTFVLKECLFQVLVAEIEHKQSRIDECQKYSEQYSSAVKVNLAVFPTFVMSTLIEGPKWKLLSLRKKRPCKLSPWISCQDYELQLMTFRAMVDSQHKSPLKKRRMNSSSDAIQQEVKQRFNFKSSPALLYARYILMIYALFSAIFTQFMDLRTRYTALVTLMTQYVKFASETLKRTEDEEVRDSYFKNSLAFLHLQWLLHHLSDCWGSVLYCRCLTYHACRYFISSL